MGTMTHVFWECPKIRTFWFRIFGIIRRITNIPLQQLPEYALLGHRVPKAPKHTQALIGYIFLGAKITIAKYWKKPSVPLHAAKSKISWIMTQEKLYSTMDDSGEKFEKIWEPWASYLKVKL